MNPNQIYVFKLSSEKRKIAKAYFDVSSLRKHWDYREFPLLNKVMRIMELNEDNGNNKKPAKYYLKCNKILYPYYPNFAH